MAIVVDARCPGCGRPFASDWPAGHALLHPVLVDRRTGAVHAGGSVWYARRFQHLLASREYAASVEIAVRGECRKGASATLVNCVDFLYSHALLKLLSAVRHMRESPEDDVVVVVPRPLGWLVPAGAVVIEVDLPWSRGTEWVEGLDATVEEVLAPAERVAISPAVSQPDLTREDLSLLGDALAPSAGPPRSDARLQIGLSLRNDRLWLGPPRLWFRVARRLLPASLAQRLLSHRQHRNYARLVRRVRERHPEAHFVVFGIGEPRGLPDYVEDTRTLAPAREESRWLDDYRDCQVLVGIHGANLLLPSLLSGAVVDLLPVFKLPNINQDLIIPRESASEPKLTLFRYRIVPAESTAETVAAIVLSVIDDAEFHHRNTIENRAAYETPRRARPVSWRQVAL